MPKALLVLLCSLLSLVAQAQSAPAPPPATPAPARAELSAGRRDTLAALGNLYARRRRGGTTWLLIGSGFTAAIIRGVASGSSGGNAGGAIISFAVLGGIPAAIGISKKARFSEAREDAADRAYRSGQPLPRSLSRRLSRKDFQ